jgi:hypothetical protein
MVRNSPFKPAHPVTTGPSTSERAKETPILAPTLAIGRCFIKDHLSFLSPTNVFTVLAAMSRETLSVKALARALLEGGISRGSGPFTPEIFTAAAMAILAAED